MDPPWLKSITVTPELIYRYQMAVKGLEDVLESDLNALKQVNQVNNILQSINHITIAR